MDGLFGSIFSLIFCLVPVFILLIAGGIVFGLVTGKLKPGRRRNSLGSGMDLSSFD
jgi:hypothetical protein